MARTKLGPRRGRRDSAVDVGATPLAEPEQGEISAHIARGLGWKLVSQVSLQGTRLVVTVALARLLTPHQFGVAGMALVLSAFVIPFSDMGLGPALVQRRTLTEDDRSTVFWTSLGAGVIFTGAGLLAAPYIARFYGNSSVKPLVEVLSLSFVITALGSTQRSLLVRAMNFRSLELRYVSGTLVGGIVAIVLATRGYGAWALVGQELSIAIVSTVLLWVVVPWRPTLRFARASFRELGGFGIRQLGGAYFTTLNRNTDNLLIGRFLGARPLGLYAFAYNLMLMPVTRIVGPVQQVVFPAFSRLQDDPEGLAALWIRANRVIAAICGPILAGLMVTAPDAIPLVFGHRWRHAVPVVEILCWVGIVQCLQTLNDSALQARNAVSTYLRFQGISFAVNLVAFVVGLRWGIVGVAGAFAVTTTVTGAAYAVLIARVIGIDLGLVVRSVAGTAQAVLGMTACGLLTRYVLEHEGWGPAVRLTATFAVCVPAYALLLGWRAPQVLDEIRRLFSGRRRAKGERGRQDVTIGETAGVADGRHGAEGAGA